jgi:hypothetical protein
MKNKKTADGFNTVQRLFFSPSLQSGTAIHKKGNIKQSLARFRINYVFTLPPKR